jgi:hypothetical protein
MPHPSSHINLSTEMEYRELMTTITVAAIPLPTPLGGCGAEGTQAKEDEVE